VYRIINSVVDKVDQLYIYCTGDSYYNGGYIPENYHIQLNLVNSKLCFKNLRF
jgi:hypothetical protein